MKTKFNLLKPFFVFLFIAFISSISFGQDGYKKGSLRIKFSEKEAAKLSTMQLYKGADGITKTGINAIDQLNEKHKATSLKRVFPFAGKYEKKHMKYGLHLWYEVAVDKKSDIKTVTSEYSQLAEITLAEPIYDKKFISEYQNNSSDKSLSSLTQTPNDPRYPEQWHYNNTGQTGGTPDADIDLPEAWVIQTGSSDVIVSVHDGGVDFEHVDLSGNMWVNPNEIAGNNIDDDNNGFVDDIHGYNFADNTGTIAPGGHGTHVGGTVAAETNNSIGVAGVAGGTGSDDGVRLMSCQVFSFSNGGFAQSYIYAADNGSVISQNSWGYTVPNTVEQAVLDAIDYFIAEAGKDDNGIKIGPMAGGIVIFAAGNDGANDLYYPGYYDKVMAVAGTDHNDNKYNSSNFGPWVELAAPAVSVLSTTPNNSYSSEFTGTSMACPHVSGTAALLVSQFKDDGITPTQVWERLVNSTDPLNFAGSEDWGSGRLNAFKALAEDDGTPPSPITNLSVLSTGAITATFNWTSPADQPDGYPVKNYDFRASTFPITSANFDSAAQMSVSAPLTPGNLETIEVKGLSPGTTYYFAVKSVDVFGNVSAISNVVMASTETAAEITVSGDPSVSINVEVNPIATGTFNILNSGAMDLTYDIVPVYRGRVSTTSTLVYPGKLRPIVASESNIRNARLNSGKAVKDVAVPEFKFVNNYTKTIIHDDGDDEADGKIGVTAGSDPAAYSAAAMFEVPDSMGDKFTLTHVSGYLEIAPTATTKPSQLSIIKGGSTPAKGEVMLIQEFDNVAGSQFITTALEVPLTLIKSDTFWIVYSFENLPIRTGYDDVDGGNKPGANLAYFNGVWNDIQEQPGWSNYVWNIRAIQSAIDGVTLDITNGSLVPNASQDIQVTYDANKALKNGKHTIDIFILNNDPLSPAKKVVSEVVITGLPAPSIAVNPTSISSSINARTNPIKTESLTIVNNGQKELFFDLRNPIEASIASSETTINYPKGKAAKSAGPAPSVSSEIIPAGDKIKLSGAIAYGQEVYPNKYFVSLSTDNPAAYISQKAVTLTIYAGDFGKDDDDFMYVIDNTSSDLLKLDIATGSTTVVGNSLAFTDLACDKKSGVMYGAFYQGNSTSLYTINLGTGATTLIGSMGLGIVISMACDGDGNLFGLNLDDNIYSIDKNTGATTLIGSAGFNANYAQSMAWDPKNDIVYLAAYNGGTSAGELRILDRATGATTSLGGFPGNGEIAAFGFPGEAKPRFLSASPLQGSVAPDSSIVINVELNATKLPNGDYTSEINIHSNDELNPLVTVPVSLNVYGQPGNVVLSSDFIEFGAVFVNAKKEVPFKIYNDGIGDLFVHDITSNIPLFGATLNDSIVGPGDSIIVKAFFSSTFMGQFNGILTLHTDDIETPQVQITVTATGISAPVMVLNPDKLELTLEAGDKKTEKVIISNYGQYPLKFSIPAVSAQKILSNPDVQKNNSEFIENLAVLSSKEEADTRRGHPVILGAGGPDNFGYSWIDSEEEGGPVYSWVDITSTGTEILPNSDDGSLDVELPFNFAFYGEPQSEVTIGANGYLSFKSVGTDYTNDQIPNSNTPNNFIAPFWDDLRPSNKRGQVFYEASADKFVVQYEEVGNYPTTSTGTITCQVILYPNGQIEYLYNNVTLSVNNSATIGIENKDGSIGMQVAFNTEYVKDSLAVLIFPGRIPFDVDVTPLYGIIQPNKSQELKLTIDASDLLDGNYSNEFTVSSNDPLHSNEVFVTKLDVVGHPKIMVNADSLKFDPIFQGFSNTNYFVVRNLGTKQLTIKSITSGDSIFVADFNKSVAIAPYDSLIVEVTFNAINLGVNYGTILITSDDEFGNEIIALPAMGTTIDPPSIAVSTTPSPINLVMNSGDKDSVVVTISNSGGYSLDYQVLPPFYSSANRISPAQLEDPVAELNSKEEADTRTGAPVLMGQGGPDNSGYLWVDSDQGSKVTYDWTDISGMGTNLNLGGDNGVNIDLPFEFPFYQGVYKSVTVASNGFLTFGDQLGSIGGFSNQAIPSQTQPNNLIAPLWDDLEPQLGNGVFVYSTDDYVVVQYDEAHKYFGDGTATFQVILYATGDIKYQYNDVSTYGGLTNSTVGIENADGTDALRVVFNSTYVKDELAVLIFNPAIKGTLEPGLSVDIPLVIDATGVYDGVYEAPIKVRSNDPLNSEIEVPTTLTVFGVPEISLSTDTIRFNKKFVVDTLGALDIQPLVIKNSGSKVLILDSVYIDSGNEVFTVLQDTGLITIMPQEELTYNVTFKTLEVGVYEGNLVVISNDSLHSYLNVVLEAEALEPPVLSVVQEDSVRLELMIGDSLTLNSTVTNLGGNTLEYHTMISAPGKPSIDWLSMTPSDSIRLDSGQSQNHNILVNSLLADRGENMAHIVYESNDPVNSTAQRTVFLYINQLPEIGFFTGDSTKYVNEGDVLQLELQAYDPEGGELAYSLADSNTFTNITVGDTVLITHSPGFDDSGDYEFTLNITDDKGESISVTWNIVVTDVNRAPMLISDLDNKMYFPTDGADAIDLSMYIVDPDGDELTYTASNNNTEAYSVEVDKSTLYITPIEIGTGVVTVQAKDSAGLEVVSTFNVRVRHTENHAPELTQQFGNVTLYTNVPTKEVDLNDFFIDRDWDKIHYSFTIAGEASVNVSLTGSVIRISPWHAGMTVLTIYADDNRGGVTATTMGVMVVKEGNGSPFLSSAVTNRFYSPFANQDRINLSSVFGDPDGDALNFIAKVETGDAVEVNVENNTLTITPVKVGESTIVIYASDEKSGIVSTRFKASVSAPSGIEGHEITGNSLTNYPNPARLVTTIAYELAQAGHVRLEMLSSTGSSLGYLVDQKQVEGSYLIDYQVDKLSSGIYFYRLVIDGRQVNINSMIIE